MNKSAKPKKNKETDGEVATGKSGKLAKLVLPLVLGVTSFSTVYFLPQNEVVAPLITANSDHQSHEKVEGVTESTQTSFITLEPFLVSLKGRTRILRLSVTLEAPQYLVDEIDPNNPKLRDTFMGYLSALGMEQIEDSSFLILLRAQLTRRAEFVLGADNVQNVLITDFMVR